MIGAAFQAGFSLGGKAVPFHGPLGATARLIFRQHLSLGDLQIAVAVHIPGIQIAALELCGAAQRSAVHRSQLRLIILNQHVGFHLIFGGSGNQYRFRSILQGALGDVQNIAVVFAEPQLLARLHLAAHVGIISHRSRCRCPAVGDTEDFLRAVTVEIGEHIAAAGRRQQRFRRIVLIAADLQRLSDRLADLAGDQQLQTAAAVQIRILYRPHCAAGAGNLIRQLILRIPSCKNIGRNRAVLAAAEKRHGFIGAVVVQIHQLYRLPPGT